MLYIGTIQNAIKTLRNNQRLEIDDEIIKNTDFIKLIEVMNRCWDEEPQNWPSFTEILESLQNIQIKYNYIEIIEVRMSCYDFVTYNYIIYILK